MLNSNVIAYNAQDEQRHHTPIVVFIYIGSDLTNVFIVCFAEFRLVADVTSFGAVFHNIVASFTHAFKDRLLYPV